LCRFTVLQASHGKLVRLVVPVPVHVLVAGVHVPVPRIASIVLRGAPPVAVAANVVEAAAVTVAAGQSRNISGILHQL